MVRVSAPGSALLAMDHSVSPGRTMTFSAPLADDRAAEPLVAWAAVAAATNAPAATSTPTIATTTRPRWVRRAGRRRPHRLADARPAGEDPAAAGEQTVPVGKKPLLLREGPALGRERPPPFVPLTAVPSGREDTDRPQLPSVATGIRHLGRAARRSLRRAGQTGPRPPRHRVRISRCGLRRRHLYRQRAHADLLIKRSFDNVLFDRILVRSNEPTATLYREGLTFRGNVEQMFEIYRGNR